MRFSTLALSVVLGNALFAQSFPGTWQGELKSPAASNTDLRAVLKISTNAADRLAGDFYLIQDQVSVEPAVARLSATGSTLKFVIDGLNGTYEGRMSPDGTAIQGTWTQQGKMAPLTFIRATPATAWEIPEPPSPPKMMSANADPAFEVATIKPSDPNRPGWRIGLNPSGVNTLNTTLIDLIKFAYDMQAQQIMGAPSWADSDKFDIVGKPDMPGMPNIGQMKAMLRKLFAERFSLVFHKEKKELAAYAITVAASELKIRREEHSESPLYGIGGPPQQGVNVGNATVAEFASWLQMQFMDLPVIDETGLGDVRYSFVIKFTPDAWMRHSGAAPGSDPNAAPDPESPPDLFAAMEQQLGLRMRRTKALVDVMVIDRVEKPSSN